MREFVKQRALGAGRLALQGVERLNPHLAQRLRQEARQLLGRPEPGPDSWKFDPATLPWLDKPEADIERKASAPVSTGAGPRESRGGPHAARADPR